MALIIPTLYISYELVTLEMNHRHVTTILDSCSILSGTLFHINWNTVPCQLESCSS